MKKLHKIVVISIKKEIEVGDIFNCPEGNGYGIIKTTKYKETVIKFNGQSQQLLLLSYEEIKEDDYILCNQTDGSKFIHKVTKGSLSNICIDDFKIIAAYPKLDNLTTFQEKFIKEWVNNPVNEVEVDYQFLRHNQKEGHVNGILIKNNEVICSIPATVKVLNDSKINGVDYENTPIVNDLEQSIEEAAKYFCETVTPISPVRKEQAMTYFVIGAKSDAAKQYWQQGMYSEQEIKILILKYLNDLVEHRKKTIHSFKPRMLDINDWFKQNKKK